MQSLYSLQPSLTAWANGTLGSANLNTLYADYQAGHTDNVTNWLRGEAGNNASAPGWANYTTGISPEIAAIQGMIAGLQNEQSAYVAAGGEDEDLLDTFATEIKNWTATLKQYQAAPGANQ